MAQTIFILGTDSEQCAELREILQSNIADTIVTTSVGDRIPRLKETDTVIITSEERNTGVLYRHLLNRLEEQIHRAQVLGELIHLSSSSLRLEDVLEKVVAKSTEILGDTAFVILKGEEHLRLEAAFSTVPDRLNKMLVMAINSSPQTVMAEFLGEVLEEGKPVLIEDLQQARTMPEMQAFIEKHSLMSVIATPIRTKDRILGAFVSFSAAPRTLGQADLESAAELADFTAIVVENARLFAEVQRSATTDSLTGVFNTRFFREVLSREAARAQRYSTSLSLLMIDVDSFKLINDTFGHLVGDKVLMEIGHILQKTVRNTDLVFRCGGDEFGVVLPGTTTEGALHVAEKILQKVQAGPILQMMGYAGAITVSIGISDYQRGSHYEALVAEADQALYASKRASKNCVRTFAKGQNN
jgi:diguanylate cyclase (GGDEF)-like protein